ncbi:hypothetical protein OAN307_c17570 [Octadecabacter antarcticus 307]|uniref:Uncharacterized protein n=1 Tax=Octadecabacter antarcticus 307 TaxID=391626 RepID=M9R5D6_9RHOB|nr:hypothetical protein OAN307_c17570 [Octadecabacter antarcticus 307]
MSSSDWRLNPCDIEPVIGADPLPPSAKITETAMKQGLELVGWFQFHLPPVFRPLRSASLSLPPREGHEETGAAMKQPHLEAPHEPLNLLADWISREQLAGELGITSDTLARGHSAHA